MSLLLRALKWGLVAVIFLVVLLGGGLAVWLGSAWHEAGELLASHDMHTSLAADPEPHPLSDAEWLVLSATIGRRVSDASQICPRGEEETCPRRQFANDLGGRIYNRRQQSGTLKPALVQHFLTLQIERKSEPETLARVYLDGLNFGLAARGVEPASQAYFGKPAADLSVDEALNLGVMSTGKLARSDAARRAKRVSDLKQLMQVDAL